MTNEKFTFFWRGPFSQWRKSNFTVQGVSYNCAEQFMMAEKAKLFKDLATFLEIMNAKTPDLQKALGRKVANFDQKVWELNAKLIVYRGNHAKFTQNLDLLDKLIQTQGTTLVEASPYDCIWGIGLAEEYPGIEDRNNWRGLNWLGEVLTTLRDDLIKGEL